MSKFIDLLTLRLSGRTEKLEDFTYDDRTDVRKEISEKYGFTGDLLDIFAGNKGLPVHKWNHYIPIYDRYFSRFRGTKFRFLEIGVFKGGSMSMWRKYFGPDATIYGIDIDEDCRKFDGMDGCVRIGSQADPDFLAAVVREMGGVDVVLDDGSHRMEHVKKSLEVLFPKVSDGGIYMIEDLHTAYLRKYGGGFRSPKNFYSYLRGMIDDMHKWYHFGPIRHKEIASGLSSIHIYDSITVLEKNGCYKPANSLIQ